MPDWASLLRLFLRGGERGVVAAATVDHALDMPPDKSARMAMGWAPVALDRVCRGAQGSNVRWAATALMDERRERVGFAVCNDGRTRVLTRSAPLVHALLSLAGI